MMTYTFDVDGNLLDVWHKVDDVCYVLSGQGTMWVWQSCGWRRATDDERAQYLPGLEVAKAAAPRLQRVWLPVVQGG